MNARIAGANQDGVASASSSAASSSAASSSAASSSAASSSAAPSQASAAPPSEAAASAATAPAVVTPTGEFEPEAATRPVEHWYGWQPALFDLGAALQVALGYALGANALYVTGGITYFVGPMSMHLYHGRVGNITIAAAMRLAGPGVGAGGGYVVNKIVSPSKDGGTAALVGIGVGCLAAAVIDDVLVSHETLQFWEQNGSITITPTFTRSAGGISLSGTF